MSDAQTSLKVNLKPRSTPWWSIDPRTVLTGYMRGLALVFLVSGLARWAVVIGASEWAGQSFETMIPALQASMVFFGVVDLVAAVGLWLGAPWGGVVWLLAVMTRIVLHSVFMATFGQENLAMGLQGLSVVAYLGLSYWAHRTQTRWVQPAN